MIREKIAADVQRAAKIKSAGMFDDLMPTYRGYEAPEDTGPSPFRQGIDYAKDKAVAAARAGADYAGQAYDKAEDLFDQGIGQPVAKAYKEHLDMSQPRDINISLMEIDKKLNAARENEALQGIARAVAQNKVDAAESDANLFSEQEKGLGRASDLAALISSMSTDAVKKQEYADQADRARASLNKKQEYADQADRARASLNKKQFDSDMAQINAQGEKRYNLLKRQSGLEEDLASAQAEADSYPADTLDNIKQMLAGGAQRAGEAWEGADPTAKGLGVAAAGGLGAAGLLKLLRLVAQAKGKKMGPAPV